MRPIFTLTFVIALASAVLSAPPHQIGTQYLQFGDHGTYTYSYNGGNVLKEESRSIDGAVHGSYSYLDANNVTQTVSYTADEENGFVVIDSNLSKDPIGKREPIQAFTQLLLPGNTDVTVEVTKPPTGNPILSLGELLGQNGEPQPVLVPVVQGFQPQVPSFQWCGKVPCAALNDGSFTVNTNY